LDPVVKRKIQFLPGHATPIIQAIAQRYITHLSRTLLPTRDSCENSLHHPW